MVDEIKMLIAEDDAIPRKFLLKMLSEFWDGPVLVAEDGLEAWELMQKDFASLLIIDWMMPGLTGIELCKKIRETDFGRYVYIILLTAKDNQQDVLEGLNAGADDYVRKPFNAQELQLRIKAGLRVINLENQLAAKNSQLKSLNEKLEELVRVDPLMQIGNRYSFYEEIKKSHYRFMRYGDSYGLYICDVDKFKQYNDTYGHQAGDQVLRAVAQCIKNNLREGDEAFRYGGEEIVVLLPLQQIEGTLASANRVCQAVADMNITHEKSSYGRVTISIGATACTCESLHANWKEVLEEADQALYQAKESGRNQVCVYTPQDLELIE